MQEHLDQIVVFSIDEQRYALYPAIIFPEKSRFQDEKQGRSKESEKYFETAFMLLKRVGLELI